MKEHEVLSSKEWTHKAEEALKDPEIVISLLEKLKKMIEKTGLKEIRHNLELMIPYVKDVVSGTYKDYNTTNLVLIMICIIYVVSPVDIIPDFIPVLGFTDDVTVVAYAMKIVSEELRQYETWRNVVA
jgi:uncharacterized membrane protein YkvA (DUF1232 family)